MAGLERKVLPVLGGLLLGAAGLFATRPKPPQASLPGEEIFRRSPIAMWVYDPETLRFLDVNDAAVARYGYSREEFLQMDLMQIRPSEDADRLRRAFQNVSGERESGVHRHLTKSGRMLSVSIRSHDTVYNGRAARLVYASDVTFQERIERVAQLGTFIYDHESGSSVWSDGLCRLLGISPEDAPNPEGLWAYDHPDDAARVRTEIERAKSERREYGIDHRIVRADGAVLHVQERGYWIFSEDGAPVRTYGTVLDITERKTAQAEIEHAAYHDSLTGLLNREGLIDRLGAALSEHSAEGLVPVYFLDLDRFKIINDTIGHRAGDEVLVEIARRLDRELRAGEALARTGGDEFVIVGSPLREKAQISDRAAQLLDVVSSPFTIGAREHVVSASLGIGVYPADGRAADALLRSADVAMYAAKALGGNTFHFYTIELQQTAARRFRLESALRRALEREQFRMHYQPVLDSKSKKVVAVEALLRWIDPDSADVSPSEFIAFAEETGFIRDIGAWVFEQTFAQTKRWADNGTPVRTWINISASQLADPELPRMVRDLLERHGVDGSLIGFELTERAFIGSEPSIVNGLRELRSMGVRLALDDFGVQYSSLAYLQRLPIDTVKIDRAFVNGIAENRFNASIVRAIVGVTHHLGFHVTAEGVETDEELKHIAAFECDTWQGFLFSAAVPPDQISGMLAAAAP
jgi:diguanylate cyclase (GGDEF)-like protein/PAS domain S-box-containing protein